MHSYNVGVNLKIIPALDCIESVSRISNLILLSKNHYNYYVFSLLFLISLFSAELIEVLFIDNLLCV